VWYKHVAVRFFGLVTKHACDGRTDGQNYDSQDRASIACAVKMDSTGRTGQNRRKSNKRFIFHLFGEKPPTEAIYIKNCVVGDLVDVITRAKFQSEIIRGYHFTGVEFSIFLLIFEWALQQCSATALPVI